MLAEHREFGMGKFLTDLRKTAPWGVHHRGTETQSGTKNHFGGHGRCRQLRETSRDLARAMEKRDDSNRDLALAVR